MERLSPRCSTGTLAPKLCPFVAPSIGVVLAFVCAMLVTRVTADRLGRHAGRWLGAALTWPSPVDPEASYAPPPSVPAIASDTAAASALRDEGQVGSSSVDAPTARRTAAPARTPPAILVTRSTVLDAIRRGIRPAASFVPATADHPAGLSVTGWAGAGTALRDHDVITRVNGRSPKSVEDVVSAVAAAYRHRTYAVSGEIWRSGKAIRVTVLLPIPEGSLDKASGKDAPTATSSVN